jgi:peptidoglycan/LPS O-acetylase OafA/YrhL
MSSDMVICLSCGTRVWPKEDGTCPACQKSTLARAEHPLDSRHEDPPAAMPGQVWAASNLMFASALVTLFEVVPSENGATVGVLIAGVIALFAVLFRLRQNWARILFLVLSLLAVAFMIGGACLSLWSLRDFLPKKTDLIAIEAVNWALQLGALILLFLPRSDRWFERKKENVASPGE